MTDENLPPAPVDDGVQAAGAPATDFEALATPAGDAEDVLQTPEEIAAIEAANKERARNITKIFAALMVSVFLIFGIFLAIYIPWRADHNPQPDTPHAPITTSTALSAPTSMR